jgi:hypothetical protein
VIVEFAFVAVLLVVLVFGIINFGLILSFKQDVTRAAAEGARGGAVAYPVSDAFDASATATMTAVEGFGRSCDDNANGDIDPPASDLDGLQCFVNLHDCAVPVPTTTPSNSASTGDCVTVELVYDHDDHPLLPKMPILAAFLPSTIRASSVARLND